MGIKEPLRFGLVGARGFGNRHRLEIARLQSRGIAELVACADPSFAPRDHNAHGEFPPHCGLYASLDALLDHHPACDALIFATPIALHYEMLKQALPCGIPIYVEKPPVATMAQFEELAERKDIRQVAVAFQLISSPLVLQLKQLILAGRLGEPKVITAIGGWPRGDEYYRRNNWAGRLRTMEGLAVRDGPATNGFAHLVHLCSYLSGTLPKDFATLSHGASAHFRAREMEAADTSFLAGEFTGGTRYQIAVSHCTSEEIPMQLRVIGSEGEAVLSENASILSVDGSLVGRSGGHDEAISLAYDDFAEFAAGKSLQPAVRFEDCRGFMQATEFPADCGEIVTLPPALVSETSGEDGRRMVIRGLDDLLKRYAGGESAFEMILPGGRPLA